VGRSVTLHTRKVARFRQPQPRPSEAPRFGAEPLRVLTAQRSALGEGTSLPTPVLLRRGYNQRRRPGGGRRPPARVIDSGFRSPEPLSYCSFWRLAAATTHRAVGRPLLAGDVLLAQRLCRQSSGMAWPRGDLVHRSDALAVRRPFWPATLLLALALAALAIGLGLRGGGLAFRPWRGDFGGGCCGRLVGSGGGAARVRVIAARAADGVDRRPARPGPTSKAAVAAAVMRGVIRMVLPLTTPRRRGGQGLYFAAGAPAELPGDVPSAAGFPGED